MLSLLHLYAQCVVQTFEKCFIGFIFGLARYSVLTGIAKLGCTFVSIRSEFSALSVSLVPYHAFAAGIVAVVEEILLELGEKFLADVVDS